MSVLQYLQYLCHQLGTVSPAARDQAWTNKRLFFTTPQVSYETMRNRIRFYI